MSINYRTAQAKAKNYANRLEAKCVDLKDLLQAKKAIASEFTGSAEVITLCGVVAHQVLDKQTGLKVMAKCLSILRENGFVIAASLSPALVNSQEYEKMGYEVLNKSITFQMDRGPNLPSWAQNDFYILQKK